MTSRPVACLTALALVAGGGCSLGINAPQPNRKRLQAPVCDSGKGLVAIDTLAAVGLGIGGLAALSDDQGTGAVALVGAALFTAAALHGSSNADKCRAAFAEFQQETLGVAAQQEERRPRTRRTGDTDDAVDPQPVTAPAVPLSPKHVEPQPAPEPAPATPAPAPTPVPTPPKRSTDDWSQFWREVP